MVFSEVYHDPHFIELRPKNMTTDYAHPTTRNVTYDYCPVSATWFNPPKHEPPQKGRTPFAKFIR